MVVQSRIVPLLLFPLVLLAIAASCAGSAEAPMPAPPEPTEEVPLKPQITPAPKVAGPVTKSGIITHDETWFGEIYVTKGVEVAEDVTLNIEPGTVIKFKHWRYGYTEPNERAALIGIPKNT